MNLRTVVGRGKPGAGPIQGRAPERPVKRGLGTLTTKFT